MTNPNFKCVVKPELIEPAREAARRYGLDGTSEYIRVAFEYLIEHGLPPEFAGRRARLKIGRPSREESAMRR